MVRVLYLTNNSHKIYEAESILKRVYPDIEFVIERPGPETEIIEVQGEDLEEIARKTLELLLERLRGIERYDLVIREDSGLFIEALGGFPGPYSSYVYRKIGLEGVLRLLENIENRRAYFKSAVAYIVRGVREVSVTTGVVYGTISREPRGERGFGFDPIFIPEGFDKTFAELGEEIKILVSHRSRALLSCVKRYLDIAERQGLSI